MSKVDKLNYELIPTVVMELEAMHFANSSSLQEYAPDRKDIFYRTMDRVYKAYYESEQGAYFRDRMEKPILRKRQNRVAENSLLNNLENLTL